MAPLRERDLRALLDFVGEVHEARDLDEFRAAMLPGFQRLVATDYASYNEVQEDGRTLAALVDPEVPPSAYDAWARYARTNPLVQHFLRTRDGRAHRVSDVVPMAEFRRTPIFHELYEPLGIAHQIAFLLPSASDVLVGLALSRGGRDYTERERAMLDLTRPHLIQAYRNAETRERLAGIVEALRQGLDADGAPVIVLGDDSCVAFASGSARALVEELGGRPLEDGRPLPAPLAGLVTGNGASGALAFGRGADSLLVRRLRGGGSHVVLLLDRATRALSAEALRRLGLTPREADVLHGLARGLEPAELASELAISPRTVAKHVQRIHAKLGVRNRAQAVATAWAAAG